MDMLLYISLSIIEGLLIFYFSFSIFRINVFDYTKEVAITTILISFATFYYSESVMVNISPLLNIISMIIALVFIFRISLLHSIFIGVLGFMGCLVFQGIVVSGFSLISGYTIEEIRAIDNLRYSLQIVTDFVILLITMIVNKKRIGFTFVPYTRSIKFSLSTMNVVILVGSIIGVAVLGTMLEINNILTGTVLWIGCFINLIFIGLKKEMNFTID